MFLEDSAVGREVWRESHVSMLNKLAQSLPAVLRDKSLRDGPVCYVTVKVRLKRADVIHLGELTLRSVWPAGVFAGVSAAVQ